MGCDVISRYMIYFANHKQENVHDLHDDIAFPLLHNVQRAQKIQKFNKLKMAARVTLKDVQEASQRIAPYIHRTPVMTCSTLDKMAGRSLFFKCEIFQKVGAFKVGSASFGFRL